MNVYEATNHQKFQWIKDSEHIGLLCNDKNNWVRIRACKKRAEIKHQKDIDHRHALKGSMDADLFEVIVLSAKSEEEIHNLIVNDKFLTYFMNDHRLGIRIRAKKQMKDYLSRQEERKLWQ